MLRKFVIGLERYVHIGKVCEGELKVEKVC